MNDNVNTLRNQINILLVEDNPADVLLTTEALKECSTPFTMTAVNNGEEASDYLNCRGRYPDAVRPDIILLDINLPKKNGFELLSEIKENPGLKRIPVIILTTSSAKQDVLSAYELYANSYIIKPIDLDDFLRVIRSLENFWFDTATIP